mgnify:CR=1 FL=1|jgi:hypothetical protein
MITKKNLALGVVLLFGILILPLTLAVGEISYCAERTTNGAWCQNVPLAEVDQNFRSIASSCETTAYCKLGTCVNSLEGTCLENTPEINCEQPLDGASGGVWFDSDSDDLPQCQLGCCLIGDEAAFVTQARCNQLSSTYGFDISYRTDISNEVACIATAVSDKEGACVFEKEFERTCEFTTAKDCEQISIQNPETSVDFFEKRLCSAEEFATNCGPSEQTTLVPGRDEIFFKDTCGNLANIYDSTKINDANYWSDVVDKGESCGFSDSRGNAGSDSCGNCDYFLGSTGKAYDRTIDPNAPDFGDNICRDLGCKFKGQNFQHGETWCSSDVSTNKNLPGERYARLVCYNGEVTTEPCSDFRQETCIENSVDGFSAAACRVNKWQDCTAQNDKTSCENLDKRDCNWIQGQRFDREEGSTSNKQGSCVPKYSPGFDFWQTETDAESLCALANNQCVVLFEKGLFDDDYECEDNCHCLKDTWGEEQNNVCLALGDCGAMNNFLGKPGAHDIEDLIEVTKLKS